MEAIEFSIAEQPQAPRTIASIADLEMRGHTVYLPVRLLPRDHRIGRADELTWLSGRTLFRDMEAFIPLDSVALAPSAAERLPFSQSSNGLGAGFSLQEAIVHGWCELIERDASSLWSLRSLRRCADTEMDIENVTDPSVRHRVEMLRDAGFDLKLFDLTSDLGVPVVMALLWHGRPRLHFDVASGVCAHPRVGKAIVGALLEAAQTRVSNIAGARDDIEPADYEMPLPDWIASIVSSPSASGRSVPSSLDTAGFAQLSTRLGADTFVVPLSHAGDDIFVVKVVSGTLEDRQTNSHWRPGARAIAAMTQL